MSDKQVSFNLDLVNAIIGYLGEKPYKETFQLIAAIKNTLDIQLQPQPLAQAPAEAPNKIEALNPDPSEAVNSAILD